MQIQLKQIEIVAALNQYIAAQGINLVGKSVDISFTAGRKDTGLSADIKISDQVAEPAAVPAKELPAPSTVAAAAADTPMPSDIPTASNDPAPEQVQKASLFG